MMYCAPIYKVLEQVNRPDQELVQLDVLHLPPLSDQGLQPPVDLQ